MIAAVLLIALSSVRLDGRDVCLDSAEARLVVSRLEDRLLLLESDSLCRLRHDNDSAALVAADTAFGTTKQALDMCLLSLRQTDSMRLRNIPRQRKETSFLVSFGSGFATALTLILLWALR